MFQSERQAMDRFLNSLAYPASKQQILDQASHSDLPHQLALLLQRLDDRTYASADRVEEDLAVHNA